MLSSKKRFAFNVLTNWVATAVNMVVPFFLTPFVVHHLGPLQYGIWILAVSVVSYLALMDLGLRSAVIRFVSKANAQGQLEEAEHSIGAALWLRLLIASGVCMVSVPLALLSPHLFKIPAGLEHAAELTVLLCAIGVAVTLVSGVFGAVLTAISRFDLLSSVTVCQTVLRAGGLLLILRAGHGLMAMAVWELAVVVLAGAATTLLAIFFFPSSRARLRKPDPERVRSLWRYSFTTFIFMIAVQIVINTDSLVIGAFLSVGLVTFYSVGSSLVSYAGQVASAVSSTFVPMASHLEASGRSEELRQMLLRGTQGMLALVFPIGWALIFRGRAFIELWLGPQYGQVSEAVLRILMISLFFAMADATAGAIMMAIERHKPVARWAVYEAVLNLGLSIVLVKTVGLYGVAWGTSLSIMFTHLAFWPRYNREVLGVPAKTYLWEGWGRVTLASLPFAVTCWLTQRAWHASNLLAFFAQILAILPVYIASMLLVFNKELSAWWLTRKRQGSASAAHI